MSAFPKWLALLAVSAMVVILAFPNSGPTQTNLSDSGTPLWLLHAINYAGGISNGVRAYADPALRNQVVVPAGPGLAATPTALNNVQMNNETTPNLPEDETQVALKPSDPMIAVAAANDYVSGDGWRSTLVELPCDADDLNRSPVLRRRSGVGLQRPRRGVLCGATLLPGQRVRGSPLEIGR